MKKTRLAPTSLVNFLDQVPNEVGDILDGIATTEPEAKKTIPLVLNTLTELTNELVSYLPEGERATLLATCGTWLDVGMIIGAAPAKLKEILVRTQARVMQIRDDV